MERLMKPCRHCRSVFQPSDHRIHYCSEDCKESGEKEVARLWRIQHAKKNPKKVVKSYASEGTKAAFDYWSV